MLSRLAVSTSSHCPRCLLKHLPPPLNFCSRVSTVHTSFTPRDEDLPSSKKPSIQRQWFSLYQNSASSSSAPAFLPQEVLFGGAAGLRALQSESDDIPTTVEPSELGGAEDGSGRVHSFFGSLAEGTDVGAALMDLAESSEPVPLVSDSFTETVPATVDTKKRLVRYLPLNSAEFDVKPVLNESTLPSEEVVSTDPTTLRFKPDSNRFEPACRDVLRSAIANGNLDEIRAELSRFTWPAIGISGPLLSNIFKLFASNMKSEEDVTEMLALMTDLAKAHPRANIPDAVTLQLLAKVCAATNPDHAISAAKDIRRIFSAHSEMPSMRRANRAAPAAVALFEAAFAHESSSMHSVARMADALIELHLLDNKDVFLEVATRSLVKRLGFKQLFGAWAAYAVAEGTVAGAHVLFEAALTAKSIPRKLQERQISQILEVYETVKSPGDGVAQLILSLMATGRLMDAEVLWFKLAVDCGHFIRPLRQWATEPKDAAVNAIHIQQFATLVETCVLAEIKPKKRSKKAAVVEDKLESEAIESAVSEQPEPVDAMPTGNMAFLINAWRPTGRKPKFVTKKKYRRHKVKADQLDKLISTIQTVWIRIAENNASPGDVDNLRTFLTKNHFAMTPGTQRRAEAIYEKAGLKSPFEKVVFES
uniref:Pentatricopeptide repeat-containing protein n=1 Tax=Panagrellus redivivus TaxID=6233 RepID=A0A7E4UN04_PANRE